MRGGVAQHQHPGRLGAAARDSKQESHAEPRDLFFVEDLDVQPHAAPDLRAAFLLKHVAELAYADMPELTGDRVSALTMRDQRACEPMRVLLQEANRV